MMYYTENFTLDHYKYCTKTYAGKNKQTNSTIRDTFFTNKYFKHQPKKTEKKQR